MKSNTNLVVKYKKLNHDLKDSIVEIRQIADSLYILRYFKTNEKFCLSKTRWSEKHGKFVVDATQGDWQKFSKRKMTLLKMIPERACD